MICYFTIISKVITINSKVSRLQLYRYQTIFEKFSNREENEYSKIYDVMKLRIK